jgi:hypothetical protein
MSIASPDAPFENLERGGLMRTRTWQAASLSVVWLSLGATPLVAQPWDLTADWSDAANPFGPWSLYRAPGTLYPVNQPDYWSDARNQRAWADAPFPTTPGHTPVWMKVTTLDSCGNCSTSGGPILPGFVTPGTVVVSTSDFTSFGEPTSVGWTSPVTGSIAIGGGVWLNKFLELRPQTWELFLNDALLSSGVLTDADPYHQGDPFRFRDGSPW